jgi:cytochrome c553
MRCCIRCKKHHYINSYSFESISYSGYFLFAAFCCWFVLLKQPQIKYYFMKKITIMAAAIIVIAGATIAVSCNSNAEAKTAAEFNTANFTPQQIKHGEYLVSIMGCDDCHSPKVFGPKGPEVDMSRRLSGHPSEINIPAADTNQLKSWMLFAHDLTAYVGPWGTSFSANLTSDATGIGNWKFEQFKKAIREGVYKGLDGNRPLMPPMPWQQYKNVSDEDLRDIFAFLKSTKPVKNLVPAYIPFTAMK